MSRRNRALQPYIHDCKTCKWVSWFTAGEVSYNIYICEPDAGGPYSRTLIFRYGDEPHEYRSYPIGVGGKGNLGIAQPDGTPEELSRVEAERAIKTLRALLGDEWADDALKAAKTAEHPQGPHSVCSGQGVLFNDDGSPFDLIPDDAYDPLSSHDHYR